MKNTSATMVNFLLYEYSWISWHSWLHIMLLKAVVFIHMAKILGSSKVTVRYQITVPENVRKMMKVEVGQTLAFVDEDGKIVLKTEV